MTTKGNRFALRAVTRDDHERLDSLVGEFHDRRSYLRYLEGMTVFRRSVERRLVELDYPHSFDGWRPSLIVPELEQDIRDLGCAVPGTRAPFDLPVDRDGLLGVLYVLEGSALGARVLVRRAGELGFSANHGARHLAAQTSRPESWSVFVALLDGMAPAGIDKAAQAARMTFAAAIDAFNRIGYRERAC